MAKIKTPDPVQEAVESGFNTTFTDSGSKPPIPDPMLKKAVTFKEHEKDKGTLEPGQIVQLSCPCEWPSEAYHVVQVKGDKVSVRTADNKHHFDVDATDIVR
jgi:hypothetical protein